MNQPPPVIQTVQVGVGTILLDTYTYITQLLLTPSVLFVIALSLVIYSAMYGSSMAAGLFVLVFFLLVWNGWQLLFGTTIIASLQNVFTNHPELDIAVHVPPATPVPELSLRPQVFNIPGNQYNYLNAKALCSAYGARLATYEEVENAYRGGGEWCNYGWSDGQMALFPTQQTTFDKLQTIPGHERDCGRPGVNGGYMANPNLQFGVNCFGYKPAITPEEADIMATKPLYPKTMQDIALEQRVNYWKKRLNDILVSPFNSQSWSKI